ncbi:MAG: LPS export ABC transporter ATP-binding protein [Gemmatimonadetes bacterium]|nr:LPS export ABC transporter ATP-binding protein [Gemmatimonadota bacterium]
MTREEVARYLAQHVLTRLAAEGWVRLDGGEASTAGARFAPELWIEIQLDREATRAWLAEALLRHEERPPTVPVAAFGSALRTEGLVKAFKRRRVVDEVHLILRQGEIVGLLGPNGAGKTTSFYMIMGLIPPDAGRVFIDDEDVTGIPMYKRARKGIGYLAQEPSVFRKLTVEENILAVLETLPISQEERHRRLESLLDELSIKHLRKQKAYELSGGERRRLEITRALVRDPKFMLLDELFAGVDPIAVDDIQRIVARLKERGLGVLITDHNVRETLSITDRAYIMFDGRIHVEGTAEELVRDPQARKLYLGEDFRL